MSGTKKRQRGRRFRTMGAFVHLLPEHGFTITMGGKHTIFAKKLCSGSEGGRLRNPLGFTSAGT